LPWWLYASLAATTIVIAVVVAVAGLDRWAVLLLIGCAAAEAAVAVALHRRRAHLRAGGPAGSR
jgi:Na+/H+ antiporter NhaC